MSALEFGAAVATSLTAGLLLASSRIEDKGIAVALVLLTCVVLRA